MDTPTLRATPLRVADARYPARRVEGVGLRPDGRLLALNSFENRVYQVFMDEGAPLVVASTAPGAGRTRRSWRGARLRTNSSSARFRSSHPLVIDGRTLHHHADLRCSPAGRPALEFDLSRTSLEWMGRFIGRIHAVGALKPSLRGRSSDIRTFGEEPRDFLRRRFPAARAGRRLFRRRRPGARRVRAAASIAPARWRSPALGHGDRHAGNVLRTDAGPHFVDFDDARMGPAVQDL